MGCIKIKRKKVDHNVMRKILDYLKEGKPLAMFPEGTRSEDGKISEPFSGIGFFALKASVPIIPCFIKGSSKALPKKARFFKFVPISVYIGEPIRPEEFRFKGDKRDAYRLFSKMVMNRIAQLAKTYGD